MSDITPTEEIEILERIEKQYPELSDEYLICLYNGIQKELAERRIIKIEVH